MIMIIVSLYSLMAVGRKDLLWHLTLISLWPEFSKCNTVIPPPISLFNFHLIGNAIMYLYVMVYNNYTFYNTSEDINMRYTAAIWSQWLMLWANLRLYLQTVCSLQCTHTVDIYTTFAGLLCEDNLLSCCC